MTGMQIARRWMFALAALGLASAAGAATISGSASYRERMALPPGAVFEATLEDVSRADAPATVIGRARLDPAGSPPFMFTIEYDGAAIQAGHRYSLRASVKNDGQLLFTTDRSYPVLQGKGEAPVQMLLRRTGDGAAASRTALGSLPASFEGTLPCADCSGTRWHLDVLADHSYRLRIAYEGKPSEQPFDEIGTWTLSQAPTILRLTTGQSEPQAFALKGDGLLTKLDRKGKPIASTLNYSLKRLPAYAPIEPHLTLTGLYRYMADAATIQLCTTGQTLPVATEGDNAALERAYGEARTSPGAPMLVSLDGRIAERPPMEGTGTRATVVVDQFHQVMPGAGCETAQRPPAPVATALQETYWKLTRLGEAAVVASERQREAHLILHKDNQRVSGSSGCNRLLGGYTLDGEQLSFGNMGSTMMACVEGMEQEQRFLAALQQVARWQIKQGQLTLLDASGKPLARFEAVALR
ncbi:META domain-containing protein [Niveibacterium sp. COAC-50]|uniref:META domain-containing protein n=1 Tax=Niveibacterium sp. COAC-50 TaxID=2729384 RepID=UPI00155385DD|nr:META domain-containing protein [Niveibacterium sp. COAC-50]